MFRGDIGDYGTDEAHLKNTVWGVVSWDTRTVGRSLHLRGARARPALRPHALRIYARSERVGPSAP
jgi:hypothetical protein